MQSLKYSSTYNYSRKKVMLTMRLILYRSLASRMTCADITICIVKVSKIIYKEAWHMPALLFIQSSTRRSNDTVRINFLEGLRQGDPLQTMEDLCSYEPPRFYHRARMIRREGNSS